MVDRREGPDGCEDDGFSGQKLPQKTVLHCDREPPGSEDSSSRETGPTHRRQRRQAAEVAAYVSQLPAGQVIVARGGSVARRAATPRLPLKVSGADLPALLGQFLHLCIITEPSWSDYQWWRQAHCGEAGIGSKMVCRFFLLRSLKNG